MRSTIPTFNPRLILLLAVTALSCSDKGSDCAEGAACSNDSSGNSESAAGSGELSRSAGSNGRSVRTGVSMAGTPSSAGSPISQGSSPTDNRIASGGIAGNGIAGNAINFVGASGGPPQQPCNGACSGKTPICNVVTNSCVECTDDAQCPSGLPFCYMRLNLCAPRFAADCRWSAAKPAYSKEKQACVECISDTDCYPMSPYCNLELNECVGYLASAGCSSASAPRWNATTNQCVPCRQDRDCELIPGKHLCDTGECVQCTGTRYSACGTLNGRALVCDSSRRTCTTDRVVGSGDACTPCVSDAQCKGGQLCAEQRLNHALVGQFCFWREGDPTNGAPASCANDAARPYAHAESSVRSVDRTSATLCGLGVSTCVALNQHGTSCTYEGKRAPGLCGYSPGTDASCIQDPSTGAYVCAMACTGDEDCPKNSDGNRLKCEPNSSPSVCALPQ